MSDAEGIRNLIGTGLVQLTGGLLTATIALGVLFYLNWRLTASTIFVLLAFGAMMAVAFKRLRPLFRKRSEINAEVTGRLGEALGGIRTVKVYTAEQREERIFADGIERLFRNVASTITGTSAVGAATTVIVGVIGVLMIIVGGRSIVGGSMTLGDFVMYIFFIGLVAAPLVQIASIGTQISEAFAGLDRIREIRQTATEDQEDERREPIREIIGRRGVRRRELRVRAGRSRASRRLVHDCRRDHHGSRRIERSGEEHAHRPRDGVQSPDERAACSWMAETSRRFDSATIARISAS